ncbi:MAG: MnhB domain-containing protein, partial [Acidaminobacteraceae bacterium]
PFILLYGIYIILNGDLSPGGGFQGGVVLGSSYVILYFISGKNSLNVKIVLKLEKILFIVLLIVAFSSYFTKGTPISSFTFGMGYTYKVLNLILLNTIIGLKVTLGIIGITSIFIEEGKA